MIGRGDYLMACADERERETCQAAAEVLAALALDDIEDGYASNAEDDDRPSIRSRVLAQPGILGDDETNNRKEPHGPPR